MSARRHGGVPGAGLVSASLKAYPRSFRERFGGAMEADAESALLESVRQGRIVWMRTLVWWCGDAIVSGLAERLTRTHTLASTTAVRRAAGSTMFTDFRHALRRLRRSPGSSVVVMLTLALGLGLMTAVFHAVNVLLIHPLAYPAAERLVRIHMVSESGRESTKVSGEDAADWLANTRAFDGIALVDFGMIAVAGGAGEAEYARAVNATHEIFEVLGSGPTMGRGFDAAEDAPGGPNVVVLSAAFWKRAFGGADDVLGRELRVQGRPHTVIGVLPADFEDTSTSETGRADIWLPLRLDASAAQRGSRWLTAIGRLAPGIGLKRATDELAGAAAVLAREHPETNAGWTAQPMPLQEALWGSARTPLLLLLAGAGFILLIACANLTNLEIARGMVRQREVAIQRALGAGRSDIVRQVLVENLLLAAGGGAAGFALAWLLSALLRGVLAGRLPRMTSPPDVTVAGFTVVLALFAALSVGMLPALHVLRADPTRVLKQAGGGPLPGRHARSVRHLLVGGQVALALVLLVGAALMLRSFGRLVRVDPGFVADRVLTWELTLPRSDYPATADLVMFQSSLVERIEALPGVAIAGAVDKLPFGSRWGCGGFAVEGRPIPQRAQDWPCAESRAITSGYPKALGIPLRRGRLFVDADNVVAEPVVLVNETFARVTWPAGDAIGQRIAWVADTEGEVRWRKVVGIIGDVRHRGLDVPPLPEVYMPYRQAPDRRMSFVVRATAGDALRLAPAIRGAVRDMDGVLPLRDLGTLDERVSESLEGVHAGTWTVAGLAVFALVLAVIGIYGVLAYFVAQRGAEFAVRVALGARDRDIARLVLMEGTRTALVGAAIGLAASLAGTRLMRSMLFDVSPTDPVAFGCVTLLLITVAALASWLPARRALRSEPTTALRGAG